MSILSGQSIRRLNVFRPFTERAVSFGRSYGLSHAGYDVRLAQTLWVWPMFGRLGSTIEHFTMPRHILGEVKDKSSNARRFITVQNTVIEPGWRGHLTLEITRHRPWPVRIRAGTPIAQIVLYRLDEPAERPYAGKYQDQAARPVAAISEAEGS